MAVIMSRFMTVRERVNYVEWLQSNGQQYIDTGFRGNSNSRVVMDVDTGNDWSINDGFPGLFGDSVGTASKKFCIFLYNKISGIHDQYAGKKLDSSAINPHGRHVFDKNKNTTSIDGTPVNTFSAETFATDGTMCLFVTPEPDYNYYSAIKMYSCQIYDNGTLIRDYWPCYDPSGVACLYDKVEKKYYYNQGTGEFSAGGNSGGDTPQPDTCVVTLTGSGSLSSAVVTINGLKYTGATTVAVEKGTEILCWIASPQVGYLASVYLNGTQVAYAQGGETTYTYTVTKNCTITLAVYSGCGEIRITTS